MTALRQRMLEDLQIRNYAPATVECYVRSVAEFAKHFDRPPDQLGAEEIRSWQLFLLREKGVKVSLKLPPILRQTVKSQNSLNGEFDSWECLDGSSRGR